VPAIKILRYHRRMTGEESDRSGRPDPDALLRHVEAAEYAKHRGSLKIFLGYASGVGKSFRMLDEGRRRRARGEDVVVAAAQEEMSPDVAAVLAQLEVVPSLMIDGSPVIDVAAILKRRPRVCLVDGLAHDNPPGSRHAKRYQDVEELLRADISVLTTINIEYIEEQQPFIERIIGRVRMETVPQRVIDAADEVVIVDAPPNAQVEQSGVALDPAVRARQLAQLRERALLLTADVVDRQLEAYLELNGIQPTWGTQERILVCMTPRANAAVMLASGRRNADRFHGELFAIYVNQPNLTPEDQSRLARNVTLAKAQEAQVDILEGKNPVRAILDYARAHGITQLFVGHNLQRGWRAQLTGSPLDRLIEEAEGMDVRVFPH
jgi:two-component system, OmpR family, sensor histidine kinase KdpD